MLTAIRNAFRKRQGRQHAIVSDEDGVRLFKGEVELRAFGWDAIRRIVTYKKGLWTTDLVCVEFELANFDTCLLHEEMVGFEELRRCMATKLPRTDPDWLIKMIHPAFERNFTVLYERT